MTIKHGQTLASLLLALCLLGSGCGREGGAAPDAQTAQEADQTANRKEKRIWKTSKPPRIWIP